MTPRKPRFAACVMCRRPMEAKRSSRTFCSAACRQRAYRRRRDGLPEAFQADGASTSEGPVSLRRRRERLRRQMELVEAGLIVTHDDWEQSRRIFR